MLNKGDGDAWDEGMRKGVEDWIDDIEVPWRCLRVSEGSSVVLGRDS